MTKNKRFTLAYRRRRQQRTNYKTRLALLKSRTPRLVIRKTNAHTVVQVVQYDPDGDRVLASASTAQLADLGWKHATSNLPAAYAAGLLAGMRAAKAGVAKVIVDLGMQRPHHGGRLFAAVKGVSDAGVEVPVSEDAFPSDERISGAHIDAGVAASVENIKQKGK